MWVQSDLHPPNQHPQKPIKNYHGEVYFYWAKNRRLGSTVAGLAAVQPGFYVFNLNQICIHPINIRRSQLKIN
jgi:hypothetical protein